MLWRVSQSQWTAPRKRQEERATRSEWKHAQMAQLPKRGDYTIDNQFLLGHVERLRQCFRLLLFLFGLLSRWWNGPTTTTRSAVQLLVSEKTNEPTFNQNSCCFLRLLEPDQARSDISSTKLDTLRGCWKRLTPVTNWVEGRESKRSRTHNPFSERVT